MINGLLILLFVSLAVMLFTVYRMVKTGKIRAKGAKKRRKQLLPFIYKKDKQKISIQ